VGLAGLIACAVAGIVKLPGVAVATPATSTFVGTVLAKSFWEEIKVGKGNEDDSSGYSVKIRARDPSDVYVVSNIVAPGGHSGWHTHPGPSVVSVVRGTATVYHGNDPSCTPTRYGTGMGFVDQGSGHVHLVRNEGPDELETVAFQIVPHLAARRIDAPDPGFCPNL
jgi:predicted metal-dependent enzyme (double-stranded beta helix superfamily)